MGGAGERALPPGVCQVLPGLAEIPAVVPGIAFRAVLAELVNYRSATHNGLEAMGFAFDKARHLAAVAVADKRQAVRIYGKLLEHGVHARHDVAVVSAAQVIFVGSGKGWAASRTAARIRPKYRPSQPDQEIGELVVAIGPRSQRPAMHIHNQRHPALRRLRD